MFRSLLPALLVLCASALLSAGDDQVLLLTRDAITLSQMSALQPTFQPNPTP